MNHSIVRNFLRGVYPLWVTVLFGWFLVPVLAEAVLLPVLQLDSVATLLSSQPAIHLCYLGLCLGYVAFVFTAVWRSSNAPSVLAIWRWVARISSILILCFFSFYVYYMLPYILYGSCYFQAYHGLLPTRATACNIEHLVKPTPESPWLGFWRTDCANDFGLAIVRAQDNHYASVFCGPGSCGELSPEHGNDVFGQDDSYPSSDTDSFFRFETDGTKKRYLRCKKFGE